jgi:hypothetical protein
MSEPRGRNIGKTADISAAESAREVDAMPPRRRRAGDPEGLRRPSGSSGCQACCFGSEILYQRELDLIAFDDRVNARRFGRFLRTPTLGVGNTYSSAVEPLLERRTDLCTCSRSSRRGHGSRRGTPIGPIGRTRKCSSISPVSTRPGSAGRSTGADRGRGRPRPAECGAGRGHRCQYGRAAARCRRLER